MDRSRTDEATKRAALLMGIRDPRRLARGLAEGLEPDAGDLDLAGEVLDARGLRAWVPFAEEGAPVLVVRGAPPERPGIAVVGARASDPYGLSCAARVARDAVALGRPVVSGGAEGCDAAAHRAAMEAGGRTVVVLGSGHDRPYPGFHAELFEEVVRTGGAVVSPFWPTTPPGRHRFLLRNRVIAALAAVTVVARAGARSGALSTARAAEQMGREVRVVPSDVGEGLGVGCNGLLARGARSVTGLGDLASALGERAAGSWPVSHGGAPDPWPDAVAVPDHGLPEDPEGDAGAVLSALREEALDVGGILRRTGLEVEAAMATLVELEIAGRIERIGGQRYRLRGVADAEKPQ